MRRGRSMGTDGFQAAPGALPAVLRQVRAFRGRSGPSVAKSMGLPVRTYQAFEAGHQRLHIEMILRFAEVLDVDPFAVLIAVLLKAPSLAVVSADNKLTTALVLELKAFQERSGHTGASLRTTQYLNAYRMMFDGLAEAAANEAEASRHLLAQLVQTETPARATE